MKNVCFEQVVFTDEEANEEFGCVEDTASDFVMENDELTDEEANDEFGCFEHNTANDDDSDLLEASNDDIEFIDNL